MAVVTVYHCGKPYQAIAEVTLPGMAVVTIYRFGKPYQADAEVTLPGMAVVTIYGRTDAGVFN